MAGWCRIESRDLWEKPLTFAQGKPEVRNPSPLNGREYGMRKAAETEKPLTLRVQVRGSMCSSCTV